MTKSIFINLIIFVFGLIIILGFTIYAFWYFRIFRQQSPPSPTMLDLKKKIEFVNNYSFQGAGNYLKNLPVDVLSLPTITTDEIGRESLF